MVFSAAKSTASPFQALTLRELQMLQLLADGKPYGVIAQDLNVSYKTVANTCSLIKSKLGARSLPELMRIALKHLPETPNIR
jgi:DNA-binding CsgD family transcriptional regulator